MTGKERILVSLLADVDVIHTPRRFPMMSLHAWIRLDERQSAFATRGVPWASGGQTEQARKSSQRDLEALVVERLVTVMRSGGRTVGLMPTATGEFLARAYANLPDLTEAMPHFARIIELQAQGLDRDWRREFKGWVPETLIAGGEWGDEAARQGFASLQAASVPLIIRGWLKTNSTVRGHMWYLAKPPETMPAVEVDAPEALPGAREVYDERYDQSRAAFYNERYIGGEIGPIPFPVSYLG